MAGVGPAGQRVDHGVVERALSGCDTSPSGRDEGKYRRLVSALHELVCEWDAEGTILYVNDSYLRFFGLDESVVGRSLFELIPPGAHDEQRETQRLLRDGRLQSVQVRRTYENGHTVSWVDTVLRDGDALSVVSVGRDDTDRVRAEETAQAATRRLEVMLANIADTVMLVDEGARVVGTSGRLRTDLGYSPRAWEQGSVFGLIHPDDLSAALALWHRLMQSPGEAMSSESRIRSIGGEWVDFEVAAVNLLHDPAVQAVVVTMRNVTHRKRVEAELERQRREALELSRSRSAFVATVSHELRNPLHGLLGLSELLLSGDLPPAERELAASVQRQVASMRRTVDDLLDLARLHVGGMRFQRAPVDVRAVVESVVATARLATDHPIELTTTIDEALPRHVLSDEDRLRQVLANLVGNAVKFTPAGRVAVRAALDDEGLLQLEVEDTGIGIAPADVERVFDEFVQGTSDRRGAGLGLAIVQRVVHALGGSVHVTSRLGVGSTFTVRVPFEVAAAPAQPATPDAGRGRRVRVLVVEDDAVNQLVARRQLERIGVDVDVAGTGADALAALQQARYDLVFMDYQLPDLDGPEITRRLRRDLPDGGPPVVAMTGSALEADRRACAEAGMDDFLSKPAGLDDLRRAVDRWTGAHPPSTT